MLVVVEGGFEIGGPEEWVFAVVVEEAVVREVFNGRLDVSCVAVRWRVEVCWECIGCGELDKVLGTDSLGAEILYGTCRCQHAV